MKIRPELPTWVPVSEIELLIFLIDCSTSMASTSTYDGETKEYHMYTLLGSLLDRLMHTAKKDNFRVSFVYFSDIVESLSLYGLSYNSLYIAKKLFKRPFDVIPGGATAIGDALKEAENILRQAIDDDSLPEDKNVTIFLFTDGRENLITDDALLKIVSRIKNNELRPSIATISLGTDADKDLLISIASHATERQIHHLSLSGLIEILEDKRKLFLEGHKNDNLTKQRIEIMRNFVETLSTTRR